MLWRSVILLVALSATFFLPQTTQAIEICNRGSHDLLGAVASQNGAEWTIQNTGVIRRNQCSDVGPSNLSKNFWFSYQYYNNASELFGGHPTTDQRSFCIPRLLVLDFLITELVTESDCTKKPNGAWVPFGRMERGERDSCNVVYTDARIFQECKEWVKVVERTTVKTDILYDRCLLSWDDSHQVHSSDLIIEWNYQAWKTVMKRLHHCVRLRAVGPVQIENVASSFISKCIQDALDSNRTAGILGLVAGIAADIASSGATAGTYAAVTAFATAVADDTMKCIQNTTTLTNHLSEQLKNMFDAKITKESHWIFWDL